MRHGISVGGRNITAELQSYGHRKQVLISLRPVTAEYFEISPLNIGSPFHGYISRPEFITPIVATTISSAAVDYLHPHGSVGGVVDTPLVEIFDLATQLRYDYVESFFPSSKIWQFLTNGLDRSSSTIGAENGSIDFDVDLVLSDGGHADNLGIVPLLWRQCHKIISVDMSADPDFGFGDEINLVRRAKVDPYIQGELRWTMPDLMAEVDSDAGVMQLCKWSDNKCQSPISEVHILKSSFGGCSSDMTGNVRYKELCERYSSKLRADFPHDPTEILRYDEARAKAYEEFGFWLSEKHQETIRWALGQPN